MRVAEWAGRMMALSILTSPLLAHAQAPSASATASAAADPATARARDLYSEAAKLFNEGKYEAARVSFAAAYSIKPHPENARALADCEWALQKWRDAAEHYAVFFANKPAGTDEAKVKVAQQRFDEARTKVGTVRAKVTPRTALVTVNGRVMKAEELPAELFMEPGGVTIEASAADLEAVKKTVTVKAGEAIDVPIELKPRQATPLPTVTATPWKPPLALVIGSGALALVGIGAGIGLTVAGANKVAEADRLDVAMPNDMSCYGKATEVQCTILKDARTAQDALRNGAVASFVAGGAFALAAIGLLIWRSSTPEKQTMQLNPVVSSQGGMMLVSGTW